MDVSGEKGRRQIVLSSTYYSSTSYIWHHLFFRSDDNNCKEETKTNLPTISELKTVIILKQ